MKNVKIFSSGIAMLILFLSFTPLKHSFTIKNEEKTITGIVSDELGPIAGASVIVKGTKKGTTTDFDGKYAIKAKEGDILEFSYVGMHETRKVGKANVINVTLKSLLLESVEMVGATSIKRKKESSEMTVKAISSPQYDAVKVYAQGIQMQHKPIYDNANAVSSNDNEDYGTLVENEFESPKQSPLSTFSIDVDNASYTNIRRFINNGQKVPKDAVRVEEMVNFFKYNYSQPKNNQPFAIHTEYSDCPWNENHKLLKIGLQGKEIPTDDLPNSNFVFLIDVSGSMNSTNKLPLLKESMKVLVNQLRKDDKVAIVVYAGAAGLVLPPTSGNKKETIINALDQLQAGGSTAGGAGIELAYKIAQENFIKNGNNRVILATDGDFNVGASSDNNMQRLIEEKRKSGVFLTCLGFGMGNYKDSKMETLADKGNGNYAYIDNIQEANRFLGKEFKGSMFAIAKDVKIQIEFNPKHVQSYRLIGYENRKLRPEDFKNDAIDAGELGSGHTVTALYEIIPVGVKSNYLKEVDGLKYSNVSPTQNYSDELATIKFRYKKPDGEKSIEIVETIKDQTIELTKASDDFKFSSAVAWFGLKLRDSKLISKTAGDDIKTLASQGKSNDTEGYKAEFIRLVNAVN
ncbi:YfbK domain-containing protein [Flavobacterium sp. U410]